MVPFMHMVLMEPEAIMAFMVVWRTEMCMMVMVFMVSICGVVPTVHMVCAHHAIEAYGECGAQCV